MSTFEITLPQGKKNTIYTDRFGLQMPAKDLDQPPVLYFYRGDNELVGMYTVFYGVRKINQ